MRFGIIGSGSWATALAKILTDRKQPINWWIRNASTIEHIQKRRHNPHYLNTAEFNVSLLYMSGDISAVVKNSDVLVIAVPSAYVEQSLSSLDKSAFEGKKIVSAIKGLLPEKNILLNYYLESEFHLPLEDYFAILGPCHAEERKGLVGQVEVRGFIQPDPDFIICYIIGCSSQRGTAGSTAGDLCNDAAKLSVIVCIYFHICGIPDLYFNDIIFPNIYPHLQYRHISYSHHFRTHIKTIASYAFALLHLQ